MNTDAERRQRAVMATDAEWERLGRAAQAAGMDRSRFVIHRALMPEAYDRLAASRGPLFRRR